MKHYNSSIARELQENLNLKGEYSDNDVIDNIQPVIDVTPKKVKTAIIKNATTSSGATTVYTTPTDQDFYLCSATLSMCKDVTCDTSAMNLRSTINQSTVEFLHIAGITLTAGSGQASISYPHPIKLDRGVTIQINHTKTAGTLFAGASISGFLTEL